MNAQTPVRSDSDAALEVEIDEPYAEMNDPKNSEAEKRTWFWIMARLIRLRSPEQILRMEIERRLIKGTGQ